jgi:chromosome segregation ATPase
MASLTAKVQEAAAAVEERTKRVTELEAQIATATGTPNAGGEMNTDIGAKMNELNAQLSKAQTELAEARQVQETLQQRADAAEGKLTSTQQQVEAYRRGITTAGLQGRVLAYIQAGISWC